MNDLRTAAQQALEFIEATNKSSSFRLVPDSNLNKAITALRAALSESADETTLDVSGATCFAATPAEWPEPLKAAINQKELDRLWFEAMRQSTEANEPYIRYRFAALVAAHERDACAKLCDHMGGVDAWDCAEAIRARGQEQPR